jgi:hypothetical protein
MNSMYDFYDDFEFDTANLNSSLAFKIKNKESLKPKRLVCKYFYTNPYDTSFTNA